MINAFRIVSLFEGISYLLLLFIAVPIKYFHGNESFVKILGMPHGILFIGYIILLIFIQKQMKWNLKTTGFIALASVIPFGTFYVDKKYLRNL